MIVFTAIFGSCDRLHEVHKVPGWDYVAFSDMQYESKVWQIVHRELHEGEDPCMVAKDYKLQPHKLFPAHDWSLWIDGNITLRPEVKNIPLHDFAAFRHPTRCCAYQEAMHCSMTAKHDDKMATNHMRLYQLDDFPACWGLWSGGFLLRKHSDPNVRAMNELWHEQVLEWSQRDQCSLPYAAWKTGQRISDLDGTIYENRYAQWWEHGI